MILERINGPDDIKKLKDGELAVLAEEIRSLGVGKVIKIDDLSLFFFHNDSPP